MKPILLHLAILVLAFELGVTVSSAWRFYTHVDVPEPFLADISEELPYPMESFENISIVCGSNGSTVHLCNITHGGHMMRACQYFSSAEEATRMLRARRDAFNVILIERSDIFDSEGQRTGETVLVFESGGAVQFSRYGEMFCTTRADSVNDLRWFDHRELH